MTTDTITSELAAIRARLIARRVNGGANEAQSTALLAELEETCGEGTLAAALLYQGFTTARGAEIMAMSLIRHAAAASLRADGWI